MPNENKGAEKTEIAWLQSTVKKRKAIELMVAGEASPKV
jgi:hypothetical protein